MFQDDIVGCPMEMKSESIDGSRRATRYFEQGASGMRHATSKGINTTSGYLGTQIT